MAPTTLFSLRYLMEKNFSVAYFQQHISPFISNIIVALFCCILLVLCVLFLNYYFFRVYELFIGKCCVCECELHNIIMEISVCDWKFLKYTFSKETYTF